MDITFYKVGYDTYLPLFPRNMVVYVCCYNQSTTDVWCLTAVRNSITTTFTTVMIVWVRFTQRPQIRQLLLGLNSATWWRHQMEPFSALLALCAGNSPVPVNSPHKGHWRGALMFSSICARINDWVNSREACDLRRHRGHYDVIVMVF